jgi:nucleotide-binding universal stress UspA family protein
MIWIKTFSTPPSEQNSAYAFRYDQHGTKRRKSTFSMSSCFAPGKGARTLSHRREKLSQLHQEVKKSSRQIENACSCERELKDDPETLKRVVGIHLAGGDPATQILNKTDELGCDTIIMGTHGKGALSHAFLGSVSEKVLRRIRKPVYIIPLPEGETDITLKGI